MEKEKHLGDSKEALLMEGLCMLGFGAVGWCYSGRELLIMLTPLGMLLLLGGAARLLLGGWHFRRGSQWRRLLKQSGWSNLAISAAAFLCLWLDLPQCVATPRMNNECESAHQSEPMGMV